MASPNTISVPADLMAQVENAARAVDQTPEEWAAEAMKRQLEEDRWHKMLERNERQARAVGIKESDLPRVIAESRRKRRER
ncbi:MAG TPA: hypothetical protein VF283_08610 [Bryobacteraceae bacterium]